MSNKARASESQRHTRAEALSDGTLIDITQHANKCGVKVATAISATAWQATVGLKCEFAPREVFEEARLHAVLTSVRCNSKRGDKLKKVYFSNYFRVGVLRGEYVRLVAVTSQGDSGEPVISILLPGEEYWQSDSTVDEHEAFECIATLVQHLWDEEEADYLAASPAQQSNHIFVNLVTIQRWLFNHKILLDKIPHTGAPRCKHLPLSAATFTLFYRAKCRLRFGSFVCM